MNELLKMFLKHPVSTIAIKIDKSKAYIGKTLAWSTFEPAKLKNNEIVIINPCRKASIYSE